jgi:hypothetical protein
MKPKAIALLFAAAITACYSDAPGSDIPVCYGPSGTTLGEVVRISPMGEQELTELRI